jgi:hypothetical protein
VLDDSSGLALGPAQLDGVGDQQLDALLRRLARGVQLGPAIPNPDRPPRLSPERQLGSEVALKFGPHDGVDPDHGSLSRRRSRVRVPSLPLFEVPAYGPVLVSGPTSVGSGFWPGSGLNDGRAVPWRSVLGVVVPRTRGDKFSDYVPLGRRLLNDDLSAVSRPSDDLDQARM